MSRGWRLRRLPLQRKEPSVSSTNLDVHGSSAIDSPNKHILAGVERECTGTSYFGLDRLYRLKCDHKSGCYRRTVGPESRSVLLVGELVAYPTLAALSGIVVEPNSLPSKENS